MDSRQGVLRAHYSRLLRKAATWVGLVAMVSTTFISVPANAAQITARKTTIGSSAPSAVTTYDFAFTGATATTIRAVKFEVCDSPLQSVGCVAPTGATSASSVFTSAGSTNLTTFAISGTHNATQTIISNATGVAGNLTYLAQFTTITNPSAAAGVQFYTRITTYTDTGASLPTINGQDYGATAVATVPTFNVNANVQESLVFCVGATVGANCTSVGASSITLAPNPLSSAAVSYNTAQLGAATNGLTGYVITYNATDMTAGGNTITKAADAGTTAATGSEQFGFTATAQSSGILSGQGTAPSGGTGVTLNTNYDEVNSMIAYDITGPTTIAQASGPTAQTTFTLLYAANVANTTDPGAYQATQNFIATATF